MVNVYYDVICRDCTAFVSTRHLSALEIDDLDSETDYSLMKKIQDIRGEDYICNRCGSKNSQIINMSSEDINFFKEPLKDYYKRESKDYLLIKFEKTPFSEITIKTESSQISDELLLQFIEKIYTYFEHTIHPKCFTSNPYGHFEIICSKINSKRFSVLKSTIDKLVICGLTKDVILLMLANLRKDILSKS